MNEWMNEWTFISQKSDMSINALSITPASLHRGVTLHTDKIISITIIKLPDFPDQGATERERISRSILL